MKPLFLKIVLVVFLVLSLFLLLLKVYFESYYPRSRSDSVKVTAKLPVHAEEYPKKKTSVSDINALAVDKNKTLDIKYKTVASEIMDFVHAKKSLEEKTESNISASLIEKKFVSTCASKLKKTIVSEAPAEEKKVVIPEQKTDTDKRPKVVIIMDDVSSLLQAEMIRELPVKITPSIFPVTEDHPKTREIAQMFRCYMVHMPMEAYNFSFPEANTLHVDDSLETIDERIAEIKRDFPDLVAINNHTGSRFTSDEEAMDKLFCVLQKYNIHFVDSRTSAETKARLMAHIHQEKVLERNIFLDNEDNVDSVLNRLRETVSYAKKHKIAIAICHPKESTFRALKQARKILRGVHVVTIDKLY